MTVISGSRLGPYEIVALLGAGGMGVVYRARDERLQRDVAVKILPPGVLVDESARKRFRKEARALAKLSHPNIAAVYDVGEQEGMDYLVMECVPGESLAAKLKSGPLPVIDVLSLGVEIAAALEDAHEHGIVHRDLKPANIMVTPKGHAKVLDFGLAKLLVPANAADVSQSLTAAGGPVGTVYYMSPEQALDEAVDSRTDLWSLGVVLYESLTGRAPFQGSVPWAVLRAVAYDAPTALRELRPDIPAPVESIVSRALAKDVADRYQAASEISRDASAVLAGVRAGATPGAARSPRAKLGYALLAAAAIVLLTGLGGWLYRHDERRRWAREEAIPEIAKLNAADQALAAFLLLNQATQYLPGDTNLAHTARATTRLVSIRSSPPGAAVDIQDYGFPDAWYHLGTTPLTHLRIPSGHFRWRLSKPGVRPYLAAPATADEMSFALDSAGAAPDGMVWVGGGTFFDYIDFIGWVGPYDLPPYHIDRLEVTNREYQRFVNSGGYRRRTYWSAKFRRGGRELSWNEAMPLFRDHTGRAGPSTWEGGHYPDGQAEYPVSGISWYEASAYAAFAGKSLPTVAQWYRTAQPDVATHTVQTSNIARSTLAPVGEFKGLGPYGTYDMAGNVREWTLNATETDRRFILGGAWNSPSYLSANPEALSPFDRSPGNGIRCVRNTAPLPPAASWPVRTLERDFARVRPASNAVFRAYQLLYAYDKTPLNAKLEGVVRDSRNWREEKVTFDAAYGKERVPAYLYLPTNVRPPYQTIVFFPSARVLDLTSSQTLGDTAFFDYIVQSGRAVLYPVYQNTYERRLRSALPGASQDIELTVQRFKDLGRSLDYLHTRADIDNDRLAYLGVSMGTADGVIYATLVQDKLRTVVFLDGGFFLGRARPGRDQVDFAPRLKKPVLMVNGRYDLT